MSMILSGDDNNVAMPMTDAQVNHLRRVLAWMQCEYGLSEDGQRGFVQAINTCAQSGIATPERASELVQERAAQINRVPAYVRQGVKMLAKAVREHDAKTGVIEQ